MLIRPVTADDAAVFQPMRIQAVSECPTAFVSSVAEEEAMSVEKVQARITETDMVCVFGAFSDTDLVGVTGIRREPREKVRHKAMLFGVYVRPEWRKHGVGRQLVARALDHARGWAGITQVFLVVNAENVPAQKLYESFGFEQYGREPGYINLNGVLHDNIFMWRRVSN
jgi:ribosomal protein S18 acetylase RimI-like enzyme